MNFLSNILYPPPNDTNHTNNHISTVEMENTEHLFYRDDNPNDGNNGSNGLLYEFDGSQINNVDYGISDYASNYLNPIVLNNKLYFKNTSSTTFGSIK